MLSGGVVPSLLVLDPPPNRPHVGTTDLDLCLSVTIVEGDTAEYERIENTLRTAGYEPTVDSFRWRQTSRLRLEVEFFCPASANRPAHPDCKFLCTWYTFGTHDDGQWWGNSIMLSGKNS